MIEQIDLRNSLNPKGTLSKKKTWGTGFLKILLDDSNLLRTKLKITPQPRQIERGKWENGVDAEFWPARSITRRMNECLLPRGSSNNASDCRESDRGGCENKNLWAVIQWTRQSQTMHIDQTGFPGINNEMSSRSWLAGADIKGDTSGASWASHHRGRTRNYLGRHSWVINFVSFFVFFQLN